MHIALCAARKRESEGRDWSRTSSWGDHGRPDGNVSGCQDGNVSGRDSAIGVRLIGWCRVTADDWTVVGGTAQELGPCGCLRSSAPPPLRTNVLPKREHTGRPPLTEFAFAGGGNSQ